MSAWQNSNRRERLPADWPKRQRRILKRDHHQCQTYDKHTGRFCLESARQVDHKIPGDNHDESNLEAICDWHHDRKSSREGNDARRKKMRQINSRFRESEQHPGLI